VLITSQEHADIPHELHCYLQLQHTKAMDTVASTHPGHTCIQKNYMMHHSLHQCAVKIQHCRLSLSASYGADVMCISRDVLFWNKTVLNEKSSRVTGHSLHSTDVLSNLLWTGAVRHSVLGSLPVLSPLGVWVLPVYGSFIHGSRGLVLFSSSSVFCG
jgi:hypothetical protein